MLDRLFVFVSDECYADVKVLASVVRSDHQAIVVVPSGVVRSHVKTREKVETMRRSPNQHEALLRALSVTDFSWLTLPMDVREAWSHFYAVTIQQLHDFYQLP